MARPIRRQGALQCSPLRPSGSKAQLRALLLADATFLWQPRAPNFGRPLHLRHQGKVKIFAPNAEQMHIINHLKESPAEERRNVLEESARRASEDALDLADLKFSELGAVGVPAKDAEALFSQQKTRLGADCGSEHELLIEKFRLKLKKVGKTTRPFRYDLNQIPYDFTVEVTNRFKGLDLIEC
ncbi:glutamine amidotransferase-like class 1 domain-containing protein 3, mitochondrial [Dama dama]